VRGETRLHDESRVRPVHHESRVHYNREA
jgi:hypothetical protein